VSHAASASRRPSLAETTRSVGSQLSQALSQKVPGPAVVVVERPWPPQSVREWLEGLDREGGQTNQPFLRCLPVLEDAGFDTMEQVGQAQEQSFLDTLTSGGCSLTKMDMRRLKKDMKRLRDQLRPVFAWLDSIGLAQYAEAFESYGILTMELLLQVDDETLDEIQEDSGFRMSGGEEETFRHHLSLLLNCKNAQS